LIKKVKKIKNNKQLFFNVVKNLNIIKHKKPAENKYCLFFKYKQYYVIHNLILNF